MPLRAALIDTNVIVAAVVPARLHHQLSAALLKRERSRFYIAAHSLAEAYSTLTRPGPKSPFGFQPGPALAAVQSVVGTAEVVSLTPAQVLDAIRIFASRGGYGPQPYGFLIAQAGVIAGATTIVSRNTRHFRALFPDQRVETPADFLNQAAGT